MKITNFYMKFAVSTRTIQYIKIIITALSVSLLGACQLIPSNNTNSSSTEYSQYYLCLKSLDKKEVLAEETKQKNIISDANSDEPLSKGKLILIYSLPNTPLHNPYKAKRLLNEHLLDNNGMSKDDLAFTLLLKDQLNIQLNMLSRQEKTTLEFNKQQHQNTENIDGLTQQLKHVNHQLMLLKQIDKNINDRD